MIRLMRKGVTLGDIEVRVKAPDESVRDVIHRESANADLVLLGLATPESGRERDYAERLTELAAGLRGFFFVKNNSLFIGDLVSPPEAPEPSEPAGVQGEVAPRA